MTQKKSSHRMSALDFLSEDLWYELLSQNIRVKKLLLKGGLGDWLLVITAKQDGQHVVAFVGSDSIENVARKTHKLFVDEGFKWQEDKYAK